MDLSWLNEIEKTAYLVVAFGVTTPTVLLIWGLDALIWKICSVFVFCRFIGSGAVIECKRCKRKMYLEGYSG